MYILYNEQCIFMAHISSIILLELNMQSILIKQSNRMEK